MCTIAASTSFPEPFETPTDRKRLGWVHKKFSGTRHSDHIALLSAYKAWEDVRKILLLTLYLSNASYGWLI